MNEPIIPKIGDCYITEIMQTMYQTPLNPKKMPQVEDKVGELVENEIFLLLEHFSIIQFKEYKKNFSRYSATENFKILTDNKIGWIILHNSVISRIFNKIT